MTKKIIQIDNNFHSKLISLALQYICNAFGNILNCSLHVTIKIDVAPTALFVYGTKNTFVCCFVSFAFVQ